MANIKVSDDFKKFATKNAKGVEEAKKAENTMMTCKMPIGWKGQAICTGGEAGKGKDRKDEKGNVREGNPYVRLEFQVINDDEYSGASFSQVWSFYDSDKATAIDRYTWMLNAMENMGLPNEVRQSEESSIEDFLKFFIDADTVFMAEVEHNGYSRDKKSVVVTRMQSVDDSTSMAPTDTKATVVEGGEAQYVGKTWDVVAVDGEDVKIKSRTTGQEKVVKITDLD